jgi:hypothetical protein
VGRQPLPSSQFQPATFSGVSASYQLLIVMPRMSAKDSFSAPDWFL